MKQRTQEEVQRLDRQFDFIREIDKEKFIGRQTYLSDGVRKENDAEHAWHMAIMTILLSEYAGEEIDVLKTVTMLLIHDIVEIDAGDTYAYDEEAKKTQREREVKAADRIFGMLPDDQGKRFRELWEEFEARETKEAKFARTMDNLQPMMLNAATDGKAWVPFYDRVVQHMIVNAIGPVFEERFYCHSYACREGKGMHAASNQLYKWLYELMVVQGLRIYAFKGDISKYFASIPHDGLKDENRRYIGDKKALYLMDNIIDRNGILPDGVGIPVGNLTSQLFANVYGNRLDKFIKHTLHIKYYVRYMDDFIILSPDLNQLKEWEKRIEEFLEEEMKLHINPKSTILYAGNGVDFCGYIHHPTYRKVRKGSVRRLKKDVKHLKAGELDRETFNRKYQSRLGHMGHADTYHVTKAIEYDLLFWEFEQTQSGLLVPV